MATRVMLPPSGEVTLFVDNLPKHLQLYQAMAFFDGEGFRGTYDFVYVPRCFETHVNKGYAFINFMEVHHARAFIQSLHGRRLAKGSTLVVADSKTQGLQANMNRWSRSRSRRVRHLDTMLYVRPKADAGAEDPSCGAIPAPVSHEANLKQMKPAYIGLRADASAGQLQLPPGGFRTPPGLPPPGAWSTRSCSEESACGKDGTDSDCTTNYKHGASTPTDDSPRSRRSSTNSLDLDDNSESAGAGAPLKNALFPGCTVLARFAM